MSRQDIEGIRPLRMPACSLDRFGRIALALLLSWIITGCDSPDRFAVETLHVQRVGWDTLDVSAHFVQRVSSGNTASVTPDTEVVTVFDAVFDTLYAGPPGRIHIPDSDLGNEERLLLELCASLDAWSTCDQRHFSASPKRVRPEFEVTFPLDTIHGYERALIATDIDLERKAHGSEEWQPLRPGKRRPIYVQARIEGSSGASLRLPIERSMQRFILPRYDGYNDFRYAIQSSMLDTDSATVVFDLYVPLSRQAQPVSSRRFVLRSKTASEREAEMRTLVERAGAQVLDQLETNREVERAFVFVNEWSYRALDRVYRATFELHWQAGRQAEWSDLSGEMQVRSDGDLGTFTLTRASEEAAERWVQQIGQSVVALGHLFPEQQMVPPAEGRPQDESSSESKSSEEAPREF